MQPTKALIDELQREAIEDARQMTIARKLELGGELFDMACEVTLSGIRAQHPGISDAAAMQMLQQRLEMGRKLETRL